MTKLVKLPKFVDQSWVVSKLRISDKEALMIGQALEASEHSWNFVKDRVTFAEQFLEKFAEDPGISSDCRRALGKGSPPIFTPPENEEAGLLPAGASARKCFGHYATCGRIAAEQGDTKGALQNGILELLEFGGVADEAFSLARDVQHLLKYKEFCEAAVSVQKRGYMLALLESGLHETESSAEASSMVGQDYSFGKLATLAGSVTDSENPLSTLSEVAQALAEASRNAAAFVQISTAPLGTESAVAVLWESIAIVEAHLEGSEDTELFKLAGEAKKIADSCKAQLIDRVIVCEVRKMADAIREKALEASSVADEAASIPVKTLSDAKKMASAFEGANALAKEACSMALKCATKIRDADPRKSNEEEAKKLFSAIEVAFSGAKASASQDAKKSAEAAAAAQAKAQAAAKQAEKEAAAEAKRIAAEKEKQAAEGAAPAESAPVDGDEVTNARSKLLAELEKFGKKRWDTSLATQTLARLTDRRKEVIGQLWHALETDADDAVRRAEKFTEAFRNTMDARRRLDAVVRLMGRGSPMDPRTAKWFTDQITEISRAAGVYVKASGQS